MRITSRVCILAITCLMLSIQAHAANETLVFALDLVRHGDRTPYDSLPAAPHEWSEGEGQLTARGMQQEYQLGVKLHQRYVVEQGLLSATYTPGSIYVRSTDYDRTIMSAESAMLGLYPLGSGPDSPALPSRFQPVPVHSVPASQDGAFLIDIGNEKISGAIAKYVYTSPEWKAKSAELETQYANWSALTGVNVSSMFDVLGLSDTLSAYLNHNVSLPNGLSRAEAEKIVQHAGWIYAALFQPKEVGDVAGKPALKKIAEYIRNAAEQKSKQKVVFISAHDVTTLGVLSALHAPLDTAPGYASDLNFSLYESGAKNYYVKVTYNDKPVSIPGCQGNVCSLSQFLNLAR